MQTFPAANVVNRVFPYEMISISSATAVIVEQKTKCLSVKDVEHTLVTEVEMRDYVIAASSIWRKSKLVSVPMSIEIDTFQTI